MRETATRHRYALPLVAAMLALAAYTNSFYGGFLFDDVRSVPQPNRRVESWPSGIGWLQSRALAGATFYLQDKAGLSEPADYHAVNLLIHIACGLLLYGLVRRTLDLSAMPETYRRLSSGCAFAVSSVWLVHPVGTAAVTYISQRYEILASLCYLLTLYALVRSSCSPRPRRWEAAGVVFCLLGIWCKETVVSAPLAALLYDRTFLSGTFGRALRERKGFYAGLAGTWVLLGGVSLLTKALTPGSLYIGVGASPWTYLLTESEVLWHYIGLCFWPAVLCFDYGWAWAESFGEVGPAFTSLSAVVGCAALWTWRRNGYAFAVLFFFVVLAPTSSFVPRPDPAFEYRLYLASAGLAAAAVLGVRRVLGSRVRLPWLGAALAAVLVCLGLRTWLRNGDYADDVTLWRATVVCRPENLRARNALVSALIEAEQYGEAFREAKRLLAQVDRNRRTARTKHTAATDPAFHAAPAQDQAGRALLGLERPREAAAFFRAALALDAGKSNTRYNLGLALAADRDYAGAVREYEAALALDPQYRKARLELANVLLCMGLPRRAVEEYRKMIRANSADAGAKLELAWVLATSPDDGVRDMAESLRLAEDGGRGLGKGSVRALDVRAAALAENGRFAEAADTARTALHAAERRDVRAGVAGGIAERLRQYEQGRPYRETTADRTRQGGRRSAAISEAKPASTAR